MTLFARALRLGWPDTAEAWLLLLLATAPGSYLVVAAALLRLSLLVPNFRALLTPVNWQGVQTLALAQVGTWLSPAVLAAPFLIVLLLARYWLAAAARAGVVGRLLAREERMPVILRTRLPTGLGWPLLALDTLYVAASLVVLAVADQQLPRILDLQYISPTLLLLLFTFAGTALSFAIFVSETAIVSSHRSVGAALFLGWSLIVRDLGACVKTLVVSMSLTIVMMLLALPLALLTSWGVNAALEPVWTTSSIVALTLIAAPGVVLLWLWRAIGRAITIRFWALVIPRLDSKRLMALAATNSTVVHRPLPLGRGLALPLVVILSLLLLAGRALLTYEMAHVAVFQGWVTIVLAWVGQLIGIPQA